MKGAALLAGGGSVAERTPIADFIGEPLRSGAAAGTLPKTKLLASTTRSASRIAAASAASGSASLAIFCSSARTGASRLRSPSRLVSFSRAARSVLGSGSLISTSKAIAAAPA